MPRSNRRSYDVRIMFAMALYVVVFLVVWPLVRSTNEPWLKVVYALTPVPPLLYVIWIMAVRILRSDELQQRQHLIGLGVATVVVSVVSIIAGFLAAADLLALDTTSIVLVWIFPLLIIVYSIARGYAARRYGGSALCDDDERMPAYQRFLYGAAISLFIAVFVYLRMGSNPALHIVVAMSVAQIIAAIFFGLRYARRQRLPPQ
jgi:hypothetical protein